MAIPTVIVDSLYNIQIHGASFNCEVTSDGGLSVWERGVCWSTSANPTTANSHISEGTGTGIFTVDITGLNDNTAYYARAYATNNDGTAYSANYVFQTPVNSFLSKWNTELTGGTSSANKKIVIPVVSSGTYNCTVFWGDGSHSHITTWNDAAWTHTYAAGGIYDVEITGTCIGFQFNYAGDKIKLTEITRWGDNGFNFGAGGKDSNFYGCSNLDITATDTPDLTNNTSFKDLFYLCSVLTMNSAINSWDVSNITNLTGCFNGCGIFNQSLNSWNTSKVTYMLGTFYGCSDFNGNITSWNTSAVTTMYYMFGHCIDFNQNISGWNTSNLTDMGYMFHGCTAFNQNISSWDTSKVTSLSHTFEGCTNFNQPIGSWNTSENGRLDYTFPDCINFNQDLSNWDVTGVAFSNNFMTGCELSITNYDALLVGWAAQNIPVYSRTFDFGSSQYCTAAADRQHLITGHSWTIVDGGQSIPCRTDTFNTTWDTRYTLLSGASASNQIRLPLVSGGTYNFDVDWGDGNTDTITSWNQAEILHTYAVAGVYDVSIAGTIKGWKFTSPAQYPLTYDSEKLQAVTQWGCFRLTDIGHAFDNCVRMDVSAVDVPVLTGITDMRYMFYSCAKLTGNTTFNSWDMSGVQNMNFFFDGCQNFNQDLDNWDVGNATHMMGMFAGCYRFNGDITTWDTSNVVYMSYMFSHCWVFNQDISIWDTSGVYEMQEMFSNAYAFNQPIGAWDTSFCINMASMFFSFSAITMAFNQSLAGWNISGITSNFDYFSGYQRDFMNANTLSIINYDATLISWAAQNVHSGLTISFNDSRYCQAIAERQSLITDDGWTINDGGQHCITVPSVITTAITDIMFYTATGGGNVTDDGYATVTDRGICWSTSHNPTTGDSHTHDGSGLGVFVSYLTTGVAPANTYYVRAYAVNSEGIAYGNEVSFTTPSNFCVPTGLTSVLMSGCEIYITWVNPVDCTPDYITVENYGSWNIIGVVAAGTTGFTYTGVPTSNIFRVVNHFSGNTYASFSFTGEIPLAHKRTVLKYSQCGPFDYSEGRLYFQFDYFITGHSYTMTLYKSDGSVYLIKAGITTSNAFYADGVPDGCYTVSVNDDTCDCLLVIGTSQCMQSLPKFSLSGIKKLWIAKWTEDLEYNYWSTADEDYFLEFTDSSFFTSTKIKNYSLITGTSIQWYSLPVAGKIATLGQRLEKVRQGYIFTDTLTFAIGKADADKWTKIATIINPENKWIYVLQCGNNFYWTGGYFHGGKITAYKFDIGGRDGDNGYVLSIAAQSENKLLTAIDNQYVINNIL